jgi:hypothetical protein
MNCCRGTGSPNQTPPLFKRPDRGANQQSPPSEDDDWLSDVANEMDLEDGLIWVYGPDDDGVMAFTDFGIETRANSSRSTNSILSYSSASTRRNRLAAAYAECLRVGLR